MKKTLLLVLASIVASYCQTLTVTPSGLKNSDDNLKSYIVLNFDSLKADKLYQQSIGYIKKKYKNPDFVVKSKIENEYLRFDTYVEELTTVKNGFATLYIGVNYATELSFKDGKVKIEFINIKMEPENNPYGYELKFSCSLMEGYPIYSKDGKLKNEGCKKDIETHFNATLKDYNEFIVNGVKGGDW